VRTHHSKADFDDAALAALSAFAARHLVHHRLHVVVNAPAGTQLHVRHLNAVVDTPHNQPLFAPVQLERLAHLELQRHKCLDHFASISTPSTDEVRDTDVPLS